MAAARILLVEDDDLLRQVAQVTLQAIGGWEVLAVASGEQAVAEAPAFGPQLMLLDVTLPGMDGPQTLQALRGLGLGGVPAIFLTARTRPAQVAALQAHGVADVIAKPFEPDALCARVRELLET